MWIKSHDSLPPKDVELLLFKDGKRWTGKLEILQIVDGRGNAHPDIPTFWSYPVDNLPDPDYKLKGIDHVKDVQEMAEKLDPKRDPEGKPITVEVESCGHDGFVR